MPYADEVNFSADIIDSRDIVLRFEELEQEKEALEEAVTDAQEALEEAKQALADYHTEMEEEPPFTDSIGIDEGIEGVKEEVKLEDAVTDAEQALEDANKDLKEWLTDNAEEFETLSSAMEELDGYRGLRDGITLISEDHFTDYAQELAEDLGYINRNVSWPYTCIDWEQAAEELKADYSTVELDGNTFYLRD